MKFTIKEDLTSPIEVQKSDHKVPYPITLSILLPSENIEATTSMSKQVAKELVIALINMI